MCYRGSNFETFAIKTRTLQNFDIAGLKRTYHPNVCNLTDFFTPNTENVCFVYEDMAISLAQVRSAPTATFKEYELAAIAAEVLQGIVYLDSEHGLGHTVTAAGVLLSLNGAVKIGWYVPASEALC